jgi:hypothetical protein
MLSREMEWRTDDEAEKRKYEIFELLVRNREKFCHLFACGSRGP